MSLAEERVRKKLQKILLPQRKQDNHQVHDFSCTS